MQFIRRIFVIILTWEARLVLSRYKPKIIAVTGSVGKTTTKDAIFAALSETLYIRKNEKSMNSDFGVPLAILGCESGWHNPLKWISNVVRGLILIIFEHEYPKWLVLEVGADRPGDIRSIARWLRPDIALFTLVPEIPVHVEFFKSPEEVLAEKRSLARYVKPGGSIILNGDDLRMRSLQHEFTERSCTYGFESYNDFIATHEEIVYDDVGPIGMRFRENHDGISSLVSMGGALGRPRIYAALAALAVAHVVGVDTGSVGRGLAAWMPPPGRMRLIPGIRGSMIIDDTYNSSPAAALSALDTLGALRGGRKIAMLADMLELGKYSGEAHREVGKRAADVADILITVGFRSRVTGEAALDSGMRDEKVREYEQDESTRAGAELARQIKKGDIILIKGSQSMRMERAVFELMAEPQKAPELLVRQESEWLAKV